MITLATLPKSGPEAVFRSHEGSCSTMGAGWLKYCIDDRGRS